MATRAPVYCSRCGEAIASYVRPDVHTHQYLVAARCACGAGSRMVAMEQMEGVGMSISEAIQGTPRYTSTTPETVAEVRKLDEVPGKPSRFSRARKIQINR